MNHQIVFGVAAAVPVSFIAGVIVHKYVISEAERIKAHVTAEVEKLRGDVSSLLSRVASKL